MPDLAELQVNVRDSGFEQAQNKVRRLDSAFSRAQATIIAFNQAWDLTARVVRGTTAVIDAAVSPAIRFESAFAGVRKTVDASPAEFARLSTEIRRMAREELPVATTEIASVAEAAGQLGVQQQSILSFAETTLKLASATNLASNEAATFTARFGNITNLPQDQFDRLGSTIVDLGNNSATTEREIAEMALRIGGAGTQIGLMQSETLGLAAALSSVGLEAQAGGSAISRTMIEVAQAVDEGGERLDLFASIAGRTSQEFRTQFRQDAAGAIVDVIEGLGRLSEQGESTFGVLEELGLSEIRVRDALLRASNAGDLFRRTLEIGNRAWIENNALTREAEERFRTTESQLQFLRNQVNGIAEDVGVAFLPEINRLIGETRDWIDANEEVLKQDLAGFFEKGISGAQRMGTIVGRLAKDLQEIVDVLGKLPDGVLELGIPAMLLGGRKGLVGGLAGFIGLTELKNIGEEFARFATEGQLVSQKIAAEARRRVEEELGPPPEATGRQLFDASAQIERRQALKQAMAEVARDREAMARIRAEASREFERIDRFVQSGGQNAPGLDLKREQETIQRLEREQKAIRELEEQGLAAFENLRAGAEGNITALQFWGSHVELVRDAFGDVVGVVNTLERDAEVPLQTLAANTRAAAEEADRSAPKVRGLSKEMRELAAQVREQVRTPFEQFNDEVRTLRDLQSAGAITQDTYNRRVEQLAENLFRGNEATERYRRGQELLERQVDLVRESIQAEADAVEDQAESLRLSVRPAEALAAELEKINQLARRRPDIITPDVQRDLIRETVDGFRRTRDEGEDTFDRLNDAVDGWGRNFTETFADSLATGRGEFRGFVEALLGDINRIVIDELITEPITGAVRKGIEGLKSGSTTRPGAISDDQLAALERQALSGANAFEDAARNTEEAWRLSIDGVEDRFLTMISALGSGLGGVVRGIFAAFAGEQDLSAGGFFKALGLNFLGSLGSQGISAGLGGGATTGTINTANFSVSGDLTHVPGLGDLTKGVGVYHRGGLAHDELLAILEEGELVVPRRLVGDFRDVLNRSGELRRFHDGGLVDRKGPERDIFAFAREAAMGKESAPGNRTDAGARPDRADRRADRGNPPVQVTNQFVFPSPDPRTAGAWFEANASTIENITARGVLRGNRLSRAVGRRS